MALRNSLPYTFLELTEGQRRRFLLDHWGFLQRVMDALERRGEPKSLATVSRTWNGWFIRPNTAVLEELERAYVAARLEDKRRVEEAEAAA